MSKATIQDIVDEGFTPSQFGSPVNFIAPDGYIATLLTRAGNWATQRVTPTNYAAATAGYVLDCIVRAETSYVCEELWKRRSKFLDGNAQIGMGDDRRSEMIKTCLSNAEDAMCDANFWISEAQRALGIDPTADMGGTGISTGYVETGAFPQTSDQPLNAEA
jgi:hypothetical protein